MRCTSSQWQQNITQYPHSEHKILKLDMMGPWENCHLETINGASEHRWWPKPILNQQAGYGCCISLHISTFWILHSKLYVSLSYWHLLATQGLHNLSIHQSSSGTGKIGHTVMKSKSQDAEATVWHHRVDSESSIRSSSSVIAPFSTALSNGVLPTLSTAPGFEPLHNK